MPLLDWDSPATWKDPRLSRAQINRWGRFPSTDPLIFSGVLDWPYGWSMRGEPGLTGKTREAFGIGVSKSQGLVDTLGLTGLSVAVIGAGFGPTVEGLNLLGVNAVGTDTSAWILSEIGNTEEADAREALSNAGITGTDQDAHEIYAYGVDPATPMPLPWVLKPHQEPNAAARGRLVWAIKALDLMQRDRWGRTGRGAVGKLLGEDGASVPSMRAIANAVGGGLDVILTEYVLPGMDDAEALIFCEILARLADKFGNAGVRVVHLVNPHIPGKEAKRHPDMNWKALAGANSWRSLLNSSNDAAIQAQEIRRNELAGAV